MGLLDSVFNIGRVLTGDNPERDNAKMNVDFNTEMAKHGIQWRVEDAKAAGLHPLAALGANVQLPGGVVSGGENPLDRVSLDDMSQDISRAIKGKLTAKDRIKTEMATDLKLQEQSLKNDLLKAQTTAVNRATNPPFPDGNVTGDVIINPSESVSAKPGRPSMEAAGPVPAVQEFLNEDGTVTRWPSNKAKQAIEDSLYEYEHMYSNRISPFLMKSGARFADQLYRLKNWKPKSAPRYYGK